MENITPRRVRRSPAQWAKVVEQSHTTNQSLRAFAAQADVPLAALYYWRAKFKAGPPSTQPATGFTALAVRPAARDMRSCGVNAIEIQLRNGRTVRVVGSQVDAALLRTVIQVAATDAPC